jgi:hypothetical protein
MVQDSPNPNQQFRLIIIKQSGKKPREDIWAEVIAEVSLPAVGIVQLHVSVNERWDAWLGELRR